MNPQVVVVCLGIALAYYGGKAVVHETKKGVSAIVHVFHKPKPEPPAPVQVPETKEDTK